jgi:hypothetical protein
MKFLKLKNTPKVDSGKIRLVSCDEKLLMVRFKPGRRLRVYEVDFSKKEYVNLDTLGGLALFYSPMASCHALSNPSMWGYYSNHVYSICDSEQKCEVYSWSNNLVNVHVCDPRLQVPNRSRLYWKDWCFRHLHDEVNIL